MGRTVRWDDRSRTSAVLLVSAALVVVGVAAIVVMAWQPWTTCPGEADGAGGGCSGAGSPWGLQLAARLTAALGLAGLVGSVVLATSMRRSRR
ncbi:hypothetical protein [Kineococcus glutinatus]